MKMDILKKALKALGLYSLIRQIVDSFRKKHPLQKIKIDKRYDYRHLGTDYGGWTFIESENLHNSTIISAGLGEDASFDVEIAKNYGATVLIIDPTPRAINHYNEIRNSIGSKKTLDYIESGRQPIEAYDLDGVKEEQLILVTKALWNDEGNLKFFSPKNKKNVSHSINNYQNEYKQDTDHINVEATTLSKLAEEFSLDLNSIELIKLDIEGAEIEVIENLLENNIYPRQICVEFDELINNSDTAHDRVSFIHKKLMDRGYRCIHTDGVTDFLYIIEE